MRYLPLGVIPGSPKGRGAESMNARLWNMDSGLAAMPRPGMTDKVICCDHVCHASAGGGTIERPVAASTIEPAAGQYIRQAVQPG
jgi:hypothetical protein